MVVALGVDHREGTREVARRVAAMVHHAPQGRAEVGVVAKLWQAFQRYVLGRSDVYGADGQLYMRRWKLGRLRVHHIVRSDADRELHDHPFDFTSFIVKGGYWEILPSGGVSPQLSAQIGGEHRVWRRPRSIVRRKAEDLHRIELRAKKPFDILQPGVRKGEGETSAWTIVWRGSYRREWGFMTTAGWMHWRKFTEKKNGRGVRAGAFASESSI